MCSAAVDTVGTNGPCSVQTNRQHCAALHLATRPAFSTSQVLGRAQAAANTTIALIILGVVCWLAVCIMYAVRRYMMGGGGRAAAEDGKRGAPGMPMMSKQMSNPHL